MGATATLSGLTHDSINLRWRSIADQIEEAFTTVLGEVHPPANSASCTGVPHRSRPCSRWTALGEHGGAVVRLHAAALAGDPLLARLVEEDANRRTGAVEARIAQAVSDGDLPANVAPADLRVLVEGAVMGNIASKRGRQTARAWVNVNDAVPGLVGAALHVAHARVPARAAEAGHGAC